MAEAERDAARVTAEGAEQASRARSETEIVRLAERQAELLLSDARRLAHTLLSEVEDQTDGTLALLEANLESFLGAIKRGRERLQERSQETVVAGIHPEVSSES